MPLTAEDRQLVLDELRTIESNPHFRGSKRYPALLNYVVNATLDGRSADLKERTLGVEVFGRDPNYDTNADPVVRVSAGEVRKRIAQYYHESGHNSRVQIELPLGSYVPEFLIRPAQRRTALAEQAADAAEVAPRPARRVFKVAVAVLVLALLATAVAVASFYHRPPLKSPTAIASLWQPLLESSQPVLIVMGITRPDKMQPEPANTSFDAYLANPNHHFSAQSALALAHVAGVVQQYGRTFEVKEAPETNLTDVHSRALVLVGARNNQWTLQVVNSLRFHFKFDSGPIEQILDSKDPGRSDWTVDRFKPHSSVTTDYAIVARFRDTTTTEGPLVVVAGLGAYGTEAAGDFVTSPLYLEKVRKQLPPGWETKNLELVLKTDVIDGKAGPPTLLAATVW